MEANLPAKLSNVAHHLNQHNLVPGYLIRWHSRRQNPIAIDPPGESGLFLLLKLFVVVVTPILVIIDTFQLSSAQLSNSANNSTDILFNAPLARTLE